MAPHKIGRYTIEGELGRGGMSVVYLARDPYIKRKVAIKVLPRQLTLDPKFRARFQQEAEVIAALEHAFIVPIYDFGEHDERPFIVMRLMPGGTLTCRIKQGPLPIAAVTTIVARISAALDQAHSQGIIHRDLKPSNILFDQYDGAFLSDFGVARLAESSDTLTNPGDFIGTPAYMSPEQARGDTELDARSDIYALGVTLFQTLSGQLPYEAPTPMGLALKHITDPVPSVLAIKPDLPPGCEAVIARTMAKEPEDRYATATELAVALAGLVSPNLPPAPEMTPLRVTTPSQLEPQADHPGADFHSAPPKPQESPTPSKPEETKEEKAYRYIYELDDPTKHIFARHALKAVGRGAIPPLIKTISGDDKPSIRCNSITILGELCQEQKIKPLMKARAVKVLVKALSDPEVSVRYSSVKALSVFKGKQGQLAVEPLANLLEDPDNYVREQARQTLKAIGGRRAREILRKSKGLMSWLKGS